RGWPVVASADLNATPTGHRAGLLRAGGLRQAAGRWDRAGTYPAQRPWPWRVAIDDVWVGPGVRIAAWRLAGSGPTQPERDDGSDHEGVLVDLDVPLGRLAGAPGTSPGYRTSAQAAATEPRSGRKP
ncbi:MAG: hypothetical protein KIT68_07275, partial [Phycisphaeraceae bacterium]|nr:hypothetical protein [Phycisphaeraceae bacterium]